MIELVIPSIEYRNQYIDMMEEWKEESKVYIAPWVLKLPYKSEEEFLDMLKTIKNRSEGNINDENPPSDTYWIYNKTEDKLIGAVNIRKFDENHKPDIWGHIGYGIRPSERRKGYATEVLKMAKAICRNMGLDKIFLACYEWNKGSEKVMINNNGILKNTIIKEGSGDIIKQYEFYLNE